MGNTLVSTISAITIAISSILAPAPAAPVHKEAPTEAFEIYVAKTLDSLRTIAELKFGSQDYWTTIWNDNPQVKNPNIIEKGDKLKITKQKPNKPVELKKEFAQKLEAKIVVTVEQKSEPATSPSPTPQASPTPMDAPKMIAQNSPSSLTNAQINFLGNCESGMTATRNSGNGFYGAFQFTIETWNSIGTSYERADLAPLRVQIDAVQRLLQRSSIWTQFPGCAAQMSSAGRL